MPVHTHMAVSQNTVCCLEYGGGLYFFAPAFFFQLGRIGMLSCLQRPFSVFCLAFISLHKQRFFSIISSIVWSPWNHCMHATWLCCRSLACLRGVTEGGGTPDVDADRPSLQLTLGSELWFPANSVGLTEHLPILLVTTGGPGVPSHSWAFTGSLEEDDP